MTPPPPPYPPITIYQIVRWTDGGFGMVSHNYDGDMLTDEIAQIHRSPGFITSNLIGKSASGSMIKEFEARYGLCLQG